MLYRSVKQPVLRIILTAAVAATGLAPVIAISTVYGVERTVTVQAETSALTLRQVIEMALTRSSSMRQAELDLAEAHLALREAQATALSGTSSIAGMRAE